jgi:hypothetical protein
VQRNLFILTGIFIFTCPLYAQYDYKIIYDPVLSSSVGAADFVTLHKLIFSGEDLILKPQLFNEDNFIGKTSGIAYRLAKTIFLDWPVDVLIGVTNHEFFGHGWRLREYQRTGIHYTINFPPPYGNGAGETFLGHGPFYSEDEDAAMRIAGVQASSTISEELRNVFLETGTIHFRQAFAYIGGISDLTQYILMTHSTGYTSNDISYYTELVGQRNSAITLSMLRTAVLLNFANPFLLYSFYSFFNRYLIYGKGEISYPMIHIFDLSYLPSFRFGLTPFGAEIRMENLLKASSRINNLYIGYDGFGQFTSLRLGVQTEHIFKNSFIDIGGKLEVWDQPIFSLSSNSGIETLLDPSAPVSGRTLGGMLSANARLHPFTPDWGVYLEAGYKSSGFTEKEELASGVIFRGGLTVRM